MLDLEYAATDDRADLDAAIPNHEVWRQQLEDLVHGRRARCRRPSPFAVPTGDLGRWLAAPGGWLGHYPAFGMLVARHQYFHQQAAGSGRSGCVRATSPALHLFNTSCRHASNQVLLLFKEPSAGWGADHQPAFAINCEPLALAG